MNTPKTPENIYSKIVNKDISLYDGIKLLISLLHKSEKSDTILECKATLKKLNNNYSETFQIFKKLLELDQKATIRLNAAKELVSNFKEKSEILLKKHILKDLSVYFLTEFYGFLRCQRDKISQLLKDSLIRKYKRVYGVIYEEASFFIDLEATQINSKRFRF